MASGQLLLDIEACRFIKFMLLYMLPVHIILACCIPDLGAIAMVWHPDCEGIPLVCLIDQEWQLQMSRGMIWPKKALTRISSVRCQACSCRQQCVQRRAPMLHTGLAAAIVQPSGLLVVLANWVKESVAYRFYEIVSSHKARCQDSEPAGEHMPYTTMAWTLARGEPTPFLDATS
eukprot:4745656-Amphidinium_carterae.1